MPCSGAYATPEEYNALMCAGLDLTDADVVAATTTALTIAASDVHAALAAVGACNCTLASWATVYLKKLNIIDAAVIHNCPCGNQLSDSEKQTFLTWLNEQFALIRTQKIEVCANATGADYPAWGVIQTGLTAWSEAEIIQNEFLKSVP